MKLVSVFFALVLAFSALAVAVPVTLKVVDVQTGEGLAGVKITVIKHEAPAERPTGPGAENVPYALVSVTVATLVTGSNGTVQYDYQGRGYSAIVDENTTRELGYDTFLPVGLDEGDTTLYAIPSYKIKLVFPQSGSQFSHYSFTAGCGSGRTSPIPKETFTQFAYPFDYQTKEKRRCGVYAIDLVSQKAGFVELNLKQFSRTQVNTVIVTLDKSFQQVQDAVSSLLYFQMENPIVIRPGWNLIPVLVNEPSRVGGSAPMEGDCISFAGNLLGSNSFFIDPRNNKYLGAEELSVSPSPLQQQLLPIVEKKGYLMTWSYSVVQCKMPEPRERIIPLELGPGWNVIPAYSALPGGFGALSTAGKKIEDFKNDCTIEKAFRWNAESQQWSSLSSYQFAGGEQGLAVKVISACSLRGAGLATPPPVPA